MSICLNVASYLRTYMFKTCILVFRELNRLTILNEPKSLFSTKSTMCTNLEMSEVHTYTYMYLNSLSTEIHTYTCVISQIKHIMGSKLLIVLLWKRPSAAWSKLMTTLHRNLTILFYWKRSRIFMRLLVKMVIMVPSISNHQLG